MSFVQRFSQFAAVTTIGVGLYSAAEAALEARDIHAIVQEADMHREDALPYIADAASYDLQAREATDPATKHDLERQMAESNAEADTHLLLARIALNSSDPKVDAMWGDVRRAALMGVVTLTLIPGARRKPPTP